MSAADGVGLVLVAAWLVWLTWLDQRRAARAASERAGLRNTIEGAHRRVDDLVRRIDQVQRRDGWRQMPASTVMPGDLVQSSAGVGTVGSIVPWGESLLFSVRDREHPEHEAFRLLCLASSPVWAKRTVA